jgi:energy-coupling factor transporter ATP-binding protein EcfA2
MTSPTSQPLVRIRSLRKTFGGRLVLDGIDLDVRQGEVTVLLGPSGSGKSTLLRSINHLERPDAGFVEVVGELDLPPAARRRPDRSHPTMDRPARTPPPEGRQARLFRPDRASGHHWTPAQANRRGAIETATVIGRDRPWYGVQGPAGECPRRAGRGHHHRP